MITICLLSTIIFAFQESEPTITPAPDREWRTPAEIDAQLMQLDVQESAVVVSTIGYSNSGQPIRCIQVAREGETPIEARSAVLVVAGVDGDMLLGTEVATDLVTTLLQMEPDTTSSLLEAHKLFVIPQVNPDAAQYYFHSVKNGQRRTVTPVDDDHDGVKDEDSNEDLNGDGFITMMRVPDLEKALFIADPDEPRLHITPEPLDGQSPAFILYSEGIDNDEDGKYNEDGTGGESIWGGNFKDENLDLKFDKPFLLAMANSGPDTNGSQFFITFGNEPQWLNGKHIIFGEATKESQALM